METKSNTNLRRINEPEALSRAIQGGRLGAATTPPGPAPPVEATGSGGPMEPSLTRAQMEKYTGLRNCLRKPCQFQNSCRNLHISLGKQKEKNNIPTRNNLDYRRRVCKMSGSTPSWGAEVDGTICTQARDHAYEKGQHAGEKAEAVAISKTSQGLPQTGNKEDENADQVELRGAAHGEVGDGEVADQEEEKVEGVEEDKGPPPPNFIKQSIT